MKTPSKKAKQAEVYNNLLYQQKKKGDFSDMDVQVGQTVYLDACASLIATSAFLRGGKFLTYPGSARSVLLGRAVRVHTNERGAVSVVVSIPTPKNAWWLESVDAHCFTPDPGHTSLASGLLMFFGPAHWLRKYRAAWPQSSSASLTRRSGWPMAPRCHADGWFSAQQG